MLLDYILVLYGFVIGSMLMWIRAMTWKDRSLRNEDAAKFLRRQNDYLRHVIKNSDTVILQRLKDQIEAEEAYDRV